VFARPPVSTQQILHPEDYIAGKKPTEPEPPRSHRPWQEARRFQVLAEGMPRGIRSLRLLRQYVTEKKVPRQPVTGAAGPTGCLSTKREKYPVLNYISDWDSPNKPRLLYPLISG